MLSNPEIEMGLLRFELRLRRPERRRMVQATLQPPPTGMARKYLPVECGREASCDSNTSQLPDHPGQLPGLHVLQHVLNILPIYWK